MSLHDGLSRLRGPLARQTDQPTALLERGLLLPRLCRTRLLLRRSVRGQTEVSSRLAGDWAHLRGCLAQLGGDFI